jgi:hypothetical protein
MIKATFDTNANNIDGIIDKNKDRSFSIENEIASHRNEGKDCTQRGGFLKTKTIFKISLRYTIKIKVQDNTQDLLEGKNNDQQDCMQ